MYIILDGKWFNNQKKLFDFHENKLKQLQKSFKEYPDLSEEVIDYLAKDTKSNIRELIGVFNRVVAFGKMSNRSLSINDCKIILKDVHNNFPYTIFQKIKKAGDFQSPTS